MLTNLILAGSMERVAKLVKIAYECSPPACSLKMYRDVLPVGKCFPLQ